MGDGILALSRSKSLENKVIVITGARSGIGAACAKIFAANGAGVILRLNFPKCVFEATGTEQLRCIKG